MLCINEKMPHVNLLVQYCLKTEKSLGFSTNQKNLLFKMVCFLREYDENKNIIGNISFIA